MIPSDTGNGRSRATGAETSTGRDPRRSAPRPRHSRECTANPKEERIGGGWTEPCYRWHCPRQVGNHDKFTLPIEANNGHESVPVLRGRCLLACPLGPPERVGLAAIRSILAGYHGIKARIVSLATEAGRMAGLPIWEEACSNARPGSKRAAFTECAASSASRSSLL